MQSQMDIKILSDGTVSIKTGNMQGEHHVSADELLNDIAAGVGGERTIESTKGKHHHHHHHAHEATHGHHHG